MIILSSPLAHFGRGEMTIRTEEIPFPSSLVGSVSYVGHPDTRALLEALGAETISGRWGGPAVGEQYLAVPLFHNERPGGVTAETAVDDVSQLRAVRCTRIA